MLLAVAAILARVRLRDRRRRKKSPLHVEYKSTVFQRKCANHRFFGREKQSEDEYTFHKAENLPNAEKDG